MPGPLLRLRSMAATAQCRRHSFCHCLPLISAFSAQRPVVSSPIAALQSNCSAAIVRPAVVQRATETVQPAPSEPPRDCTADSLLAFSTDPHA